MKIACAPEEIELLTPRFVLRVARVGRIPSPTRTLIELARDFLGTFCRERTVLLPKFPFLFPFVGTGQVAKC